MTNLTGLADPIRIPKNPKPRHFKRDDLFMAAPNAFRLSGEINAWMKRTRQPDPALALAQWRALVATLKSAGFRIRLDEQPRDWPDYVFTANRLPAEEVERLSLLSEVVRHSKGDVLYTQGAPAAHVWVLQEGNLEIFKYNGDGKPLDIESIQPGQLFGTLCRLGPQTMPIYPCTAVATTDSISIRIPDRWFMDLYNRFPAMVSRTCQLCSLRLYTMQTRHTSEIGSAQQKLRQSEKQAMIGQLAGGVAHDFKNLIAGIVGISEDLKKRFQQDTEGVHDLELIIKTSERAQELTRDLLAAGLPQPVRSVVLDINAVLLHLESMLRRLMGPGIQLDIELGGVLPIKMDRSDLEQIILNLSINARDAMPRGGVLTLRTAQRKIPVENSVWKSDAAPGRYVMLEVIDTGLGINPEAFSHIFEPFFTTKKDKQGSGLGLAMVNEIVKQNGGDIHVESSPDKGTSFRIYFPVFVVTP